MAVVSQAAAPAAAEAADGKMKKYFIFDFDGTLCNTNDIIVESWQATFERFLGRRLPAREVEATFGEVLYHTIEEKIPDAETDAVVDYYRAYQYANQEGKVHVFEGVKELLRELRARGCLIGVGTSRTAKSFWKYMKAFGMEDTVDEVVTVNDVSSHKPDPETIYAVLIKLMAHDKAAWTEAEEESTGDEVDMHIPDSVLQAAVMVGDTKYDVGCANNAGVDSVLVGWSHYIDEEDMAACGFVPTCRIDRPEELLEII